MYCYTVIYTKAKVLLEFLSSFSPPSTLAVKASQRLFTSSTSLVTMTTSLLIDSSWHTPIKASDMDKRFCNTGRLFSKFSRNAYKKRATITFSHRIVQNNKYSVWQNCLKKTRTTYCNQSERTYSFFFNILGARLKKIGTWLKRGFSRLAPVACLRFKF